MDAQQLINDELQTLKSLRHYLHRYPEVSHDESNTAQYLKQWASTHLPSFNIRSNAGDNGIMLVYDTKKTGPHILFRAELDALPIQERNEDLDYQSDNEGVAHLCGHDGHMTMVCGLGLLIERSPQKTGAVALLFQPAEETGEGAAIVRESKAFTDFKPDLIYALHNLPGEKMGKVLIKQNSMCMASTGLWLRLKGKTSHAAQPFAGNSPLNVFRDLLPHLQYEKTNPLRISTLVHMQLGNPAFGITPGDMVLALTIRSETDETLDQLVDDVVNRCRKLTDKHKIELEVETTEHFAAVINSNESVNGICDAAKSMSLNVFKMEEPTRWSEDVGVLLQTAKGALFCLGSGSNTPVLHHPSYNFPDELISTGSELFYRILVNTMNNKE